MITNYSASHEDLFDPSVEAPVWRLAIKGRDDVKVSLIEDELRTVPPLPDGLPEVSEAAIVPYTDDIVQEVLKVIRKTKKSEHNS